ncbi:MAG: hypothetical protein AAFU85_28455, partial [Planctomycetota bacterium]
LWGCEFTPDGNHLATVAESGRIRLYTFPDVELAVTLKSSWDSLRKIAFTPDGNHFAVTRFYSPGQIWNLNSLRQRLAEMGLDW